MKILVFFSFFGGLGGKLRRHTQLCFDGFYCILFVFVGFRYSQLGVYWGNFESYMLRNIHRYNEISDI